MATATTKDGTEVDLELYKFDSCPYCQKVQRVIDRLGVPVTMRDTVADPTLDQVLIMRGGKRQVPCLFIDGDPMYESSDIAAWLERHFG